MNRVGLARFGAMMKMKTNSIASTRHPGRRSQFEGRGVRVNLIVSAETYAALDRRARQNGVSLSQEARNAILRHLAR